MENNGYSRIKFQKFLLREVTANTRYRSWELVTVSNFKYISFGVVILWLFVCLWAIELPYEEALKWIILPIFEILGVVLILGGFTFYKKSRIYETLDDFFVLKSSIISEKRQLFILIKNDILLAWIDVAILWDIKKFISSILAWYKLILQSHRYIQGHMWYFGKIPQEWRDIINAELQWIINYSQEFTALVQSWISHHATELAELEKQIESQELSTENIGWKVALGLQRLSLQEHLKELEKVRV